jgi:hypothetical protein
VLALAGQDGDEGGEEGHADGAHVADQDHQLRAGSVKVRNRK